MSISPEHASHIRGVNAAFIILGQDLDPEVVSTHLRIPAHASARKGDERRAAKGHLIEHNRQGWWRIDSTPLSSSTPAAILRLMGTTLSNDAGRSLPDVLIIDEALGSGQALRLVIPH